MFCWTCFKDFVTSGMAFLSHVAEKIYTPEYSRGVEEGLYLSYFSSSSSRHLIKAEFLQVAGKWKDLLPNYKQQI